MMLTSSRIRIASFVQSPTIASPLLASQVEVTARGGRTRSGRGGRLAREGPRYILRSAVMIVRFAAKPFGVRPVALMAARPLSIAAHAGGDRRSRRGTGSHPSGSRVGRREGGADATTRHYGFTRHKQVDRLGICRLEPLLWGN
jgi:hypothetical protein